MELDEFKALYNRSADEQTLTDQNITDMITHESQGPLAQLQKKTKYTLYLFPLSIIFFAGLFIPALGAGEISHNVPMWLLFFVLFTEYIVSVLNYFTIKKMQQASGNVRENLLKKMSVLRLRYKLYFILYIALFLMMPAYLELSHFTGHFAGLAKINPFIRVAWYVLVFGCLFVIKKEAQKQQYEQYLDQLKRLLDQMQ
jgi:hypothetical protein